MRKIITIIIIITITPLLINSTTKGYPPPDNNDSLKNNTKINPLNTKQGIPYYTYFSNYNLINKEIFSLAQDKYGQIILANRRGLMVFNSKKYNYIETPGLPILVKTSPNTSNIYIACNNSYGYLEESDSNYVYKEIKPIKNFTGKINIHFDTNTVIFDYKNFIAIYNPKTQKTTKIKPQNNQKFGGIAKIKNKYCILINKKGFFDIQNDSIGKIQHKITNDYNLIFSIYADNTSIYMNDKNELFYEENNKIQKLNDTLTAYLHEKKIKGAIQINNKNIAIYTLNGGVILFNIKEKKFHSLLNSYTGLPENEIFAMTTDKNKGIWIANNFGLFRFDAQLPIINYGKYPGIHGTIISTQKIDTTLYALTTNGIFYLTKANNQEEIEQIIKKTKTYRYTQKSNIQEKTKNEQKKQNLIQRIAGKIFKKRKNKKEKEKEKNNPVKYKTYSYKVKETKKQKKQFDDLYYIFKQIKGITAKCKNSIVYDKKIFLSTNAGLYLIDNKKATTIIKDEYITKIEQSPINPQKLYIASTENLYTINMADPNTTKKIIINLEQINDYVSDIIITENTIWLSGEGKVYKLNKKTKKISTYPVNENFLPEIKLLKINDRIFAYVPHGIYKYNPGINKFTKYNPFNSTEKETTYFIKSQKNIIWYNIKNKWTYNSVKYNIDTTTIKLFNLFYDIKDIRIDEKNNYWIVADNNCIYKIPTNTNFKLQNFDNLIITNLKINNTKYKKHKIQTKYNENLTIKINLATPYYLNSEKIKYQYSISKKENETPLWSQPTTNPFFEIPLKTTGKSYIHLRAKNNFGQNSNTITIEIYVKPPFRQTNTFKFLIAGIIIIIIFFIIQIRQKALKIKNEKLKNIIKLSTKEIELQNEELKSQKEEILLQNETVIKQRNQIKKTHEATQKSIRYTRKIQEAILSDPKILEKYFPQHLIIYKPKDIISGDFYWFKEKNNSLYLALADCTGHGVPGATLSMLGTAYLNEMTNHEKNLNADEILNTLRTNTINALNKNKDSYVRDGMDITLIIYNPKNLTIQFAGAYHQLYIVRNNEIIIHKGDRMPIGYSTKNNIKFTKQNIKLKKNDTLYMFSDGYSDQFGEIEQTKFYMINFRKLILKIKDLELTEQKKLLEFALNEWKGNSQQIDDITIIAIKI